MPRSSSPLLDAQRRSLQQLRTMAGGGVDGRTAAAAPLPERPRAAPYRPASAGGGQRGFTIVIAAADASPESQASADFLCTGTADDVIIQQAIDAAWLAAPEETCHIKFTEGTFDLDADLLINGSTGSFNVGLWLQGAGMGVTTFSGGAFDLGDLYYFTLSDFTLRSHIVSADFVGIGNIHHVELDSFSGYIGFTGGSEWINIHDCILQGSTPGDDYGLELAWPFWAQVHNNYIDGGLAIYSVGTSEAYMPQIHGNHCEGALTLYQVTAGVITGNHFWDAISVYDNQTGAIGSGGHEFPMHISGNTCVGGANLTSVRHVHFVGNTVWAELDDGVANGINVLGDDCQVADNYIMFDGDAGVAGDGTGVIQLLASSNRCHVHGNTARCEVAGGETLADYGVRIYGGSDNKVFNNDLFGCWSVAAVLDGGTSTDLTGANR